MLRRKIFYLLLSSCFLFLFLGTYKNDISASDKVDYTVTPIFTSKNNNFNFSFKKNNVVKLPFVVSNNSDRSINVISYFNDGYSSNNGIIKYDGENPKTILKSSNPKMTSLVLGSRKIITHLKSHTSKEEHFTIKQPNNIFYGTILGGINSVINREDDNTHEKGSVKNIINYSSSVLINGEKKENNLKGIKLVDAYAKDQNLNFDILNHQSGLINGYYLIIKLLNNKSKNVMTKKNNHYSLAPSSIGKYKLPIINVKSGKYTLLIQIQSPSGEQVSFKKNIVINSSYQNLTLYHANNNNYIYICIFVGLVIILFAILLLKFK